MYIKKNVATLFAVTAGAIALADFTPVFAETAPAFKVHNQTNFYLHPKAGDSGTTCTQKFIAPGETAVLTDYWCGYIACATDKFDKEDGCLEPGAPPKDQEGKYPAGYTQGGYATWFSISPGAKVCGVPEGNTYECSLTDAGGTLGLTFKYKSVEQKYSAGTKSGQPVLLPQKIAQYQKIPYRGVNISGLEYDGTFLDAMFQLPDIPDMRYFAEQGMNTVRLPIRWEFVVTNQGNAIESTDAATSTEVNVMYMTAVKDTVGKYLKNGLHVIVDLHNYMRFCATGKATGQFNEPTDPIGEAEKLNQCKLVTQDQFKDIWGVLAKEFASLAKQYPDQLIFELVNEPYTHFDKNGQPVAGQEISTQQLFDYEVAAVKAIRNAGLNNLILLSGNYWDPLHGWTTMTPNPNDPNPNGKIFTAANLKAAGITDLEKIGIDMHQYFNKKEIYDGLERAEYSGTSPTCFDEADVKALGFQEYSYEAFKQKLELSDKTGKDIFGDWLKQNGIKVFLGEFGTADNENCKKNLSYMFRFMNEHAFDANKPSEGGFIGWTAWRANRHGNTPAFAAFNFLQEADYTVYRAPGQKPQPWDKAHEGTGIVGGQGNGLMKDIFTKPEIGGLEPPKIRFVNSQV